MTQTEALRVAFEALAYINQGANNQGPHTGISWRCAANKSAEALNTIKAGLEAKDEPVQVSPLQFVEMVMEKEHLVGKPIFWAEWPNKGQA
jgi:hypothetical protein